MSTAPDEKKPRPLVIRQGKMFLEDNGIPEEGKKLSFICGDFEYDVVTEQGFTISAQARRDQATFSFSSRKFASTVPKYLPQFYPDRELKELLTPEHPNKQLVQIVGMIELLTGILTMCKKHNNWIPIFIETPETDLHPAQQLKMMDFITQVVNAPEYSP